MDFLRSTKATEPFAENDDLLHRALSAGDLPAAWLLTRPLLERMKTNKLPAATAFNCGLCLYRLEEFEKALSILKKAEQSLGVPPELDTPEKRLFLQALQKNPQVFLLPLDPKGGNGLERYSLIRVRWLTASCLLRLERRQEAASAIRFLAQYQIELKEGESQCN